MAPTTRNVRPLSMLYLFADSQCFTDVLNDSRSEDSGVQQRLHLQKETEMITKSGNITQSLNSSTEWLLIEFVQDKRLPTRDDIEQPMFVDSQHETLDMKSLMKELEASSPKMQRFISSLVQKGDMERQHMLDHERWHFLRSSSSSIMKFLPRNVHQSNILFEQ